MNAPLGIVIGRGGQGAHRAIRGGQRGGRSELVAVGIVRERRRVSHGIDLTHEEAGTVLELGRVPIGVRDRGRVAETIVSHAGDVPGRVRVGQVVAVEVVAIGCRVAERVGGSPGAGKWCRCATPNGCNRRGAEGECLISGYCRVSEWIGFRERVAAVVMRERGRPAKRVSIGPHVVVGIEGSARDATQGVSLADDIAANIVFLGNRVAERVRDGGNQMRRVVSQQNRVAGSIDDLDQPALGIVLGGTPVRPSGSITLSR